MPFLFRGSNITFDNSIPIEKHYKAWDVSSRASLIHCGDGTIRGFLQCVIAGKDKPLSCWTCGRKGNCGLLYSVGPGPFLMGRVTMSSRKTCVGKVKILGETMDHIRKYHEVIYLSSEHVSESVGEGFVQERVTGWEQSVFVEDVFLLPMGLEWEPLLVKRWGCET